MLALITTAHHTCYPNPIAFRAGERVRIGHEDDEFPGWVRTFTADGNEGGRPCPADPDRAEGGAGAPGPIPPGELDVAVGSGYGWIGSWQAGSGFTNEAGGSGWIPASCIASPS